jgi:hypothetical protein
VAIFQFLLLLQQLLMPFFELLSMHGKLLPGAGSRRWKPPIKGPRGRGAARDLTSEARQRTRRGVHGKPEQEEVGE